MNPKQNFKPSPAPKEGEVGRLSVFWDKKMDVITRADFTYWFDGLSGMLGRANHAIGIVSQIFNYAIKHGVPDSLYQVVREERDE